MGHQLATLVTVYIHSYIPGGGISLVLTQHVATKEFHPSPAAQSDNKDVHSH